MSRFHALMHRLWPLVDWRRAAVLEARHRGAAAMLDESMRRTQAALALPYRLGDSDGTRFHEVNDVPQNVEPSDGEAAEPRTIVVDRDVLMRRAREASEGGADYLPPWTGEGL